MRSLISMAAESAVVARRAAAVEARRKSREREKEKEHEQEEGEEERAEGVAARFLSGWPNWMSVSSSAGVPSQPGGSTPFRVQDTAASSTPTTTTRPN